MTKAPKNTSARLIRKAARGFRVGEWLYLFESWDGYTGETLSGSWYIDEIKHHTDETVTFMAKPIRLVPSGSFYREPDLICPVPGGSLIATGTRWLEFKRDEELHRIAGPVLYVIREAEFQ
jgi:hypothetical protein